MKVQPLLMTLFLTLAVVAPLLLCEPGNAAPGGIIKSAARSPIVQIGLGIIVATGLPWFIYWFVRWKKRVAGTRKDLERLAASYRQYNWLDVRDRAIEVFSWVWSAWTDRKMSQAAAFTTHWYWQHQQLLLDRWEAQGLENVCVLKGISKVTPLFVQHEDEKGGEGSRIVMLIEARVIDYLQESASGKVVQGDKNAGNLETVWTFLWDGGAWRLNLIETADTQWDYLDMPNLVPARLEPQYPDPASSR